MRDKVRENEIKRKTSYISAVILAFLIILGAFTFVYRNMANIKINQKKTDSLFIAQNVDYYLSKNKENLNLAAANIENFIRLGEDSATILAYMKQESTATSAVVDENFSGIYGWINGEYLDGMDYVPDEDYVPKERPWYVKAQAVKDETVFIKPYIDSQTGKMIVSIAKMLEDQDSVLSMDIYLDYLMELATDKELNNEHLIIMDEDGFVVAATNEELIGTDKLVFPPVRNLLSYYEKTTNYEIFVTDYDNNRYMCYNQSIIGGWHVLLLIEQKEVVRDLWYVYYICLIAMALVFLIVTFIFKKMNKQIISVERYSGRLSAVSDIYLAMFDIDLQKDSYSTIKSLPFITDVLNKYDGPVSEIMTDIVLELCESSEEDRIRKFTSLDNLLVALKNSNVTSIEVKGLLYFARITFVVKSRDENGLPTGLILMIEDIDNEIEKRRELMLEANTDKMTGLFNRRAWEEALSETRHSNLLDGYTVICMDLNGLKRTNDNMGHAAGDEIIIGLGHMIKEHFSGIGDSFRIGGDEFAVIIKDSSVDIDKEIEEFKDTVGKWSGELVKSITVSLGYGKGNEEHVYSIDDLIKLADKRMYKNKKEFYRQKEH